MGELRSVLPKHVHILAMTATATASLRKSVIKTLGMIDPEVITENIDKTNLIYGVLRFESVEITFNNVIQTLKSERTKMPRTIIYCQHQDKSAQLYLLMKMMFGEEHVEPVGAPNLSEFRLFDYFTSATRESVKDGILKAFTQPDSSLHLVIATIAFGMVLILLIFVMLFTGDHHKMLSNTSRPLLVEQVEMETHHLQYFFTAMG